MHLGDLLEASAARNPDAVCLSWGDGEAATYAEVAHAVRDRAEEFATGARLALMLPNRPELVILWLAALHRGIAPVFLNPQLTPSEVERIVEDLGVELVVGAADLNAPLPATQEGLPLAGAEDASAIVLTSGSTGRPKYVPVPHAAYVLKGQLNAQLLGWNGSDVAYCVMPLFHMGAQAETFAPALAAGARVHLVEAFTASGLWDDMARSGTTHLHATGSLLAMASARGGEPRDLPLKRIVASLVPGLAERLEAAFPGVALVSLYGLTENPLGTLSTPGERWRPGWVGYPYLGWENVRIAESGEIQLRGPGCMAGYLGTDAEPALTPDGWLQTGDIGYRADDGLYLSGRIKEMIRRSGENIAPAEIEAAALRLPDVADAAALGHPDAVRDEEVRLFVEPVPGTVIDPAQLRAALARQLARFKLPRYIDVLETLPRTASNKADKVALAAGCPVPGWDAESVGLDTP